MKSPQSIMFQQPPQRKNKKGEDRTVGLELEFAGVDIEQTAELVQSLFGGDIVKANRYRFSVENTELGDFAVELDARLLQRMAEENILDKFGITPGKKPIRKSIEDTVDRLAKSVVPLEIIMPPVAVDQLYRMEELREVLQENRAEGTGVSLVNAFGMHINIEVPDFHEDILRNYLKSFLILYPWLLSILNIDITRRVTPFVYPFGEPYVRKVLNPSYRPNADQLISDYLEKNATRNRPLDMLPIFGMMQPSLVEAAIEGEKNRTRPTFHYRLPNSRIDDPEWRFQEEWNYWLEVERLAGNTDMMDKLGRLYLQRDKETLISFQREWSRTVAILLDLDE